nr:uncharacterized protein LOC113698128 [Coffea arabica]
MCGKGPRREPLQVQGDFDNQQTTPLADRLLLNGCFPISFNAICHVFTTKSSLHTRTLSVMEEVQEQKFVCKFCNKCCFSGKSLGGHMRRHLALIAAAKKEKVKADINVGFGGGYDHDDHHDHGDFGLEENATNSCRFSAEQSSSSLIPEKVDNHSSSMNLENDDHDQDQDNYGLRENPKKSWKISDLRACGLQEKEIFAKNVGKGFPHQGLWQVIEDSLWEIQGSTSLQEMRQSF